MAPGTRRSCSSRGTERNNNRTLRQRSRAKGSWVASPVGLGSRRHPLTDRDPSKKRSPTLIPGKWLYISAETCPRVTSLLHPLARQSAECAVTGEIAFSFSLQTWWQQAQRHLGCTTLSSVLPRTTHVGRSKATNRSRIGHTFLHAVVFHVPVPDNVCADDPCHTVAVCPGLTTRSTDRLSAATAVAMSRRLCPRRPLFFGLDPRRRDACIRHVGCRPDRQYSSARGLNGREHVRAEMGRAKFVLQNAASFPIVRQAAKQPRPGSCSAWSLHSRARIPAYGFSLLIDPAASAISGHGCWTQPWRPKIRHQATDRRRWHLLLGAWITAGA